MKASKILYACLKKADDKFHLIDNKDKIVIGVSLGKDSMALLKALKIFQYYSCKKFEIRPVYIDFGFGNVDLKPFKNFCKEIGTSLEVIESKEVFKILKSNSKKGQLPCSICSRMRKASLCKYASKIGFNKVALGHHLDDYLITLLMNMKNSNIVDTFSPKMYLTKTKITCIRPLILTKEEVIKRFVLEEKIPVAKSLCPNNNKTQRSETDNMLKLLESKYPGIRDNYLDSIANTNSLPNQFFEEDHIGENYYFRKLKNENDFANYLLNLKKNNSKPNINLIRDSKIFLLYYCENIIGNFSFEIKEKTINVSEVNIEKKYEEKLPYIFELFYNFWNEKIKPLKLNILLNNKYIKFFKNTDFKISKNKVTK